MQITKLITKEDNKSYFVDIEIENKHEHPLGQYTERLPASSITFREFKPGANFDWHTAPQIQYIIYLSGEVEVQTSGGETRVFKAGDILLAADLTGQGHITKTLTAGTSIIVTEDLKFYPKQDAAVEDNLGSGDLINRMKL